MCGDTIEMDVVLDESEETIEHVAFRGDGCAISQASASMLSEQLQGTTIEELQEMDRDDVVDMLGVDISPMRIKCAVLAEKVAQDGAGSTSARRNSTRQSPRSNRRAVSASFSQTRSWSDSIPMSSTPSYTGTTASRSG